MSDAEAVYGPVNKAVASAHLLSGMDSCSIWALIAMMLIAYVAWIKRMDYKNNDAWRLIREKQIASEAAQTEVMKHMTDEIVGMKMLITKYLLKE